MPQGDFLLHLGLERRDRLRKAADAAGLSMGAYVLECLDMSIEAGLPGTAALTAALRLVEEAARQLADDAAPVRRMAPGPSSWDAAIEDGSS
jgi:hypothetical protein